MAAKPSSSTAKRPQPSTSAPGAPKKEIPQAEFEQQSLQAHNKFRAQHGCPPLKLNKDLTAFALDWAQNLAKREAMEHRSNNKYGENIYFSGGMELDGVKPVTMWYNEIKVYDFAKSKFTPNAGHFTQVIWKETNEVGVAYAKKGEKVWVVANYNPAGNVQGLFKENVPPKK